MLFFTVTWGSPKRRAWDESHVRARCRGMWSKRAHTRNRRGKAEEDASVSGCITGLPITMMGPFGVEHHAECNGFGHGLYTFCQGQVLPPFKGFLASHPTPSGPSGDGLDAAQTIRLTRRELGEVFFPTNSPHHQALQTTTMCSVRVPWASLSSPTDVPSSSKQGLHNSAKVTQVHRWANPFSLLVLPTCLYGHRGSGNEALLDFNCYILIQRSLSYFRSTTSPPTHKIHKLRIVTKIHIKHDFGFFKSLWNHTTLSSNVRT